MSGSIELSGEEYSELVAKLAAVERELLVSQRFAESQQVLKEQNIQRWIQAQEKLASVETTLAEIFFFQAEDGIRVADVTGVQTCALPISFQKMKVLRWSVKVAVVKPRLLA